MWRNECLNGMTTKVFSHEASNNAYKWFQDECNRMWGRRKKRNSTQDPSKPSPPHVLTNQCCPCPLGTAAANDFQCTADPSTFLPFKAFTNSPFPVHMWSLAGFPTVRVHADHS